MDYKNLIEEFKTKGYCCAEYFIRLGLEIKGEENEVFANASSALCGGLKCGSVCGCLTGAALMLVMFDKPLGNAMVTQLYTWFDDKYGNQYGSINCEDILTDRSMKAEICLPMMSEVAEKCIEILKDNGLLDE